MRVAVAGGTGVLGRHVVAALRREGHDPVVLARSVGVDVVTGTGLDAALEGAGAVIDATNRTTVRKSESVAFFTGGTRHLLQAGQRAGVGHHVAVSIVGIDRVPLGYYEGKRRQEELVLAAPTPTTVVRATQFHELVTSLLERAGGVLALVPRMRIQPIAASEVADALVDAACGNAIGLAPELAGPEATELVDLARERRAAGARRILLPFTIPGRGGRAMASGGLLPTGAGPRGSITFAQWSSAHAGDGQGPTGLRPAGQRPARRTS